MKKLNKNKEKARMALIMIKQVNKMLDALHMRHKIDEGMTGNGEFNG